MDKDIEKYLYDVLESIHIIEIYTQNIKDSSTFFKNMLIQDAVLRRLSIIGDALWKANKIDASINITNIRKIISFSHILIHDYNKIEMPAVWITLTRNLTVLKEEIEIILKDYNGSSIN